MQLSSVTSEYVLGYMGAEQERLIRQAARIAPTTERLFREAGIGPGQRVLDLGSGVPFACKCLSTFFAVCTRSPSSTTFLWKNSATWKHFQSGSTPK